MPNPSTLLSEATVEQCIERLLALHSKEESSMVSRYALFPIQDETSYLFYQKQEASHWFSAEMEFTRDVNDYEACTPEEKHIIDLILAFFLTGDGIVSKNLVMRFLLECSTYEQMLMFVSQLHIESIHAETYGLIAYTLIKDDKHLERLLQQAASDPAIQAKTDFMEKWMGSSHPRAERLLAFACAEGIFFVSLFGILFWFRSRGKFHNMVFANELIRRDETLHRDYACHLCLQLGALDRPTVERIVREAVAIEEFFIERILPTDILDLTAEGMKSYARLMGDNLLAQLGQAPIWKATNPFTWTNDISMQEKANFYERKVGNYLRHNVDDAVNWRHRTGRSQEKEADYLSNPEEVYL